MRALVVYESMFGNTEVIAKSVAEGLKSIADVELVEVGSAPAAVPDGIDLVVVGGPTHALSMSRPKTRADAAKQRGSTTVSEGQGIREWIEALPKPSPTTRIAAATFDTRVDHWFAGSAAKAAARRLRRNGYRMIAEPMGFIVNGTPGPLADGEVERAEKWAASLETPVVTA